MTWFGAPHRLGPFRGLALALIVGLAARVLLISVLFGWNAVPTRSDDATYLRFATRIVNESRFETHFPLGYPLFVAAFLGLGKSAFAAIRVVQVAVGLLTIVAVHRLSRLLFGERAALIAALTTAVYPPLVFMTGRIMSETLFICLMTFSLLAFLIAERDESVKSSLLGAALFGVASTARSNLLPMVPFVPVWLLLGRTTRGGRLTRAFVSSLALAVTLSLPGFVFLTTTGRFVPFATNSGQTLYGANNALADGNWVEVNDHPELLASIPAETRKSPVLFDKAQRNLALAWVRDNPGRFLALMPKKFANAWIPGLQTSETTRRSPLAAAVLALAAAIVTLAAIAGRIMVRPAVRDGIMLAVLATYTGMSLAIYGNPRIGLFCAPVLIVYGSAFGDWLWARLGRPSDRPVGPLA